jgi:hypothetical protein
MPKKSGKKKSGGKKGKMKIKTGSRQGPCWTGYHLVGKPFTKGSCAPNK